MKKLLQRIEHEADKKYVPRLLAIISFTESIIFPIPVDVFTFTLSAAQPKKWSMFARVATIWSVLGAIAGYALGYYLFDSFGMRMIEFYSYQDEFIRVKELFDNNVFLVMFMSAFTPIPYKVFTVVGGALKVALFPFVVASILGRGLRFYLESYLASKYGKKITGHIMKKVNLYSVIFALLVLAYIIFKSL